MRKRHANNAQSATNPELASLAGRLRPTEALFAALQRGATLTAAARIAGMPLERAELLRDHLVRAGILIGADQTAGSCDTGACAPGVSYRDLDDSQKLHCAGCPVLPMRSPK